MTGMSLFSAKCLGRKSLSPLYHLFLSFTHCLPSSLHPSPVIHVPESVVFVTFLPSGQHRTLFQFSSVQFSHSVVSDSLGPHKLQHARPPCPSPTPGVHSDSRPSSQWCHPAISSSVVPFSSCPQSLPASESFPMSQLFAWGLCLGNYK